VAGKIQSELRQNKAFRHSTEEAALNILRTADVMTQKLTDLLKLSGLSPTQYNVLRILRGSAAKGLCCKEIGDRLVTRDPDVTRLIDRLEKRSLLVRTRSKEDRRYVTIHLTPDGMEMVNQLDEPMEKWNRKLMRSINSDDTKILIDLLERVREGL
jgi:DNA-binding MarR family transcriptional regulator